MEKIKINDIQLKVSDKEEHLRVEPICFCSFFECMENSLIPLSKQFQKDLIVEWNGAEFPVSHEIVKDFDSETAKIFSRDYSQVYYTLLEKSSNPKKFESLQNEYPLLFDERLEKKPQYTFPWDDYFHEITGGMTTEPAQLWGRIMQLKMKNENISVFDAATNTFDALSKREELTGFGRNSMINCLANVWKYGDSLENWRAIRTGFELKTHALHQGQVCPKI